MVRERLQVVIEEDGVAALSGTELERQSDEIPESALRHGILIREEPVVGLQADVAVPHHRLGQQVTGHRPRGYRSYWIREKEPGMGAVTRTGSLDRDRDLHRSGRLAECSDVVPPRLPVEVRCDEPAGLVPEQRVDPDRVPAGEMIVDDSIRYRNEPLMRAGRASNPGLVADAPYPLVRACRREAFSARPCVHPFSRKNVLPAAEQGPEELHLFYRREC